MSQPIVAIVGRPNVGKSTLFNRVTGRRDAIVDDQPGVTRDRKYAQADWAGKSFTLVDTGGFLPASDDEITKAVFLQVQGVIDEADVLVFLVDAVTGLTALDEELATVLNRCGKNVVLAVNKVDNQDSELKSVEYYKLGLGDPIPISALNSRNVGDFLDQVISQLPDDLKRTKPVSDSLISLAVVGRPNVGKSSFINALIGEEKHIVTEIPGTTRDAIDTKFKYHAQEFLLIDTAGLRKRARVKDAVEFYSTLRSFQSIRRCDVAVVMIDATTGMQTQDLKILNEAVRMNKGIILAVNKWDLIEKSTNTAKEFEQKIQESLKSINYIPIIFISALTKKRIYKVIDIVKSIFEERKKTIKTSELNEFLIGATNRYAPPSMDRKEVTLKYCTQVKSNPPVIAFFSNAPKSIRANYRSYLENQLRQQYGFFGVPLTLVFKKK